MNKSESYVLALPLPKMKACDINNVISWAEEQTGLPNLCLVPISINLTENEFSELKLKINSKTDKVFEINFDI